MNIEALFRSRFARGSGWCLPLVLALAVAGCGNAESTCTSFTYSDWGKCQPDGGRARTVASSSPAGCVNGAPALTEACTPEPDGVALYGTNCAGSKCHGPLATSNLKGRNATVTQVTSFHSDFKLSSTEIQAILTAVGP